MAAMIEYRDMPEEKRILMKHALDSVNLALHMTHDLEDQAMSHLRHPDVFADCMKMLCELQGEIFYSLYYWPNEEEEEEE